MKKLLAALISAFLLAAGLVAFAPSTASAACPYSGCLSTATVGVAVVNRKVDFANIRSKTSTKGSDVRPRGAVELVVTRKRTGQQVLVTRKQVNQAGRALFRTPTLKRGRYLFQVRYLGNETDGFRGSSGRGGFFIR